MKDAEKTQKQLVAENAALRQRLAALENAFQERRQLEFPRIPLEPSTPEMLPCSLEQYRSMVEDASQGVLIHQDGIIQYTNRACAAIFGYEQPEALCGRNLWETLIAREEWPGLQARTPARMRGELISISPPWQGIRKDGSRLWVESAVGMIHWQGRAAILSFFTDITERKQMEEALRVSEERLRLVMDNMPVLLAYLDNTLHYRFVNRAFERWFGLSHTALQGQHSMALIGEQAYQTLQPYIERVLDGQTVSFEVLVPYQYGGPRYVSATYVPHKDQQETVLGFFAMAEDVTTRKLAEIALRESEERYRVLVENSIQGISVISQDGKRVFANHTLVTLLGYDSLSSYLSHDAMENVAPHDRARVQEYREVLFRGEAAPTHYIYQGMRTDGRPLWLERLVAPIMWDGKPAIISTLLDVTARQNIAAERQHLEDQLRQMQKLESLGTLAGGVAHDFNNILAVIIGYTELATYDTSFASPTQHHLQAVLKAAQRAKALVSQLLTFSRPSVAERKPVDIARLVKDMLLLLRSTIPTTIAIRQAILEEAGVVLADPNQLHQVLMNLCTNAEYAMRQTGGILEVSVDVVAVQTVRLTPIPDLQPDAYIRLRVRDTGQGMDAATLERIFEPFYTTKEVGEGSGMGLAVVHGIVTNHGGNTTVESSPGQGTTFTIHLPRIGMTAGTGPPVTDDPLVPGKGRILFVDDEESLVQLGHDMLTRLGYDAVVSHNSRAALEMFRAAPWRFDLVITDQTMSEITGEQFIMACRRLRPDIPAILCTGFSHMMNADKAQALGIDVFCLKPLTIGDLGLAIQRALTRRPGGAS